MIAKLRHFIPMYVKLCICHICALTLHDGKISEIIGSNAYTYNAKRKNEDTLLSIANVINNDYIIYRSVAHYCITYHKCFLLWLAMLPFSWTRRMKFRSKGHIHQIDSSIKQGASSWVGWSKFRSPHFTGQPLLVRHREWWYIHGFFWTSPPSHRAKSTVPSSNMTYSIVSQFNSATLIRPPSKSTNWVVQ